jgi:hypothetical protein
MLGLRYVAGAIPGKSLKRKTTESDDKREKTKKYEENRKARKFNVKWLTNLSAFQDKRPEEFMS